MKLIVALALMLVAGSACDVRCQWDLWKAKYNKAYTAAEEPRRFAVFEAKLEEIARLNAEMPSAHFAVNEFSDLTSAEFLSQRAALDTNAKRQAPSDDPAPQLQKRMDYTADYMSSSTPAQDQGSCGSCWAFASAGLVEGAFKHATGKTVRLSPQQLVDCSSGAYACKGGTFESGAGWWRDQTTAGYGGAANETTYPYTSSSGTSGSCKTKYGWLGVTSMVNAKFNEAVGSGADTYLAAYGPVGITLDATTLQSYSSGVLKGTSGCQTGVNHAVLLVGWATISGTKVWIVKNSWGKSWGIVPTGWSSSNGGGFFYLERGTGACMITSWGIYYATTNAASAASSGGAAESSVCTPKSATQVCTPYSYTCGTVSDGCGGTVSCGTCSSGQSCSSHTCKTISSSSWETYRSGDKGSDWTLSSSQTTLTLVNTDGYEHRVRWASALSLTSATWTQFSVQVQTKAVGNVGIGMRLGQSSYPNAFLLWRVIAGNGAATLNECYATTGTEYCWQRGSWTFGPDSTVHTLTVVYQDSGSNVAMTPYWDGYSFASGTLSTSTVTTYTIGPRATYWPKSGYPFLLASGSGKVFYNPTLYTRSAVSVQLSTCHTESEMRGYCTKLLQVPAGVVESAKGSGDSCDTSSGSGYKNFILTITDANTTSPGTAFGADPENIPTTHYSSELAENLKLMLAEGNSAQLGFAVAAAAVTAVPIADGALIATETVAAVAAAALSTAAIIGIAVGGSVAGVALVGGTTAVVLHVRHRNVEVPPEYKPSNPLRKTLFAMSERKGVDVMNATPDRMQSITARAPPVV